MRFTDLRPVPVSAPAGRGSWVSLRGPALFLVLNAVVALAMSESRAVAFAQGVAVFAYAVWAAFFSNRIEPAIWAAAFIAASDVLWRVVSAPVPWEVGKWGAVFVLAVAWYRHARQLRRAAAPLVYLVVLMPSAAITIVHLVPNEARQKLSSSLGSSVALVVGVVLFRQLVAKESEVERILWTMLGPIVGLLAIATMGTIGMGGFSDITSTESLDATSGGFGPNQVSTVLGLGALLCLLLLLQLTTWRTRFFAGLIGAWLFGQAMLTLSRGGIYAFVMAGACVGLTGVIRSGRRSRSLALAGVTVVALLSVFSFVDSLSEGLVGRRYDDQSSTNRAEIASADLDLWASSPVWGIGPGMSSYSRSEVMAGSDTHTEYTRLVAEHGLLGLLAGGMLVVMAVGAYRQGLSDWNHQMTVGLMVWVAATMSHSATRTALVAFCFALANLRATADRDTARGDATAGSQPDEMLGVQ